MTTRCSEKRIPIRMAGVLMLGTALVAACGVPGDGGLAPTGVTSTTGQTPVGGGGGGGGPSGCPGYIFPTRCPPFATGGPYTLSGVVTLRTTSGTRPLASVGVGGFVVMANGNGYGTTPVTTDADGRYEFSTVPNGFVILYAGAPHAYQRCVAIGTVNGANGVKDIELLDSAVTRPETSADSPTLSGVVYRNTAAGKQPIAGAVIEYEYPFVIATTATTDAQGRYSFCQLPIGRGGLEVWLNGVSLGGVVVNITGDAVLDLNF